MSRGISSPAVPAMWRSVLVMLGQEAETMAGTG